MAVREDVYQALFALVTPLVATPHTVGSNQHHVATDQPPTTDQPFRTVTRNIKEVQRWATGEQPVLMLYEMDEVFGGQLQGVAANTWKVIFIFGVTTEQDQIGQAIMNPLIDKVLAAIAPTGGDDHQTLGGRVENVQPKGNAGKDHGNNSTAEFRQASYYLPIEITLS